MTNVSSVSVKSMDGYYLPCLAAHPGQIVKCRRWSVERPHVTELDLLFDAFGPDSCKVLVRSAEGTPRKSNRFGTEFLCCSPPYYRKFSRYPNILLATLNVRKFGEFVRTSFL